MVDVHNHCLALMRPNHSKDWTRPLRTRWISVAAGRWRGEGGPPGSALTRDGRQDVDGVGHVVHLTALSSVARLCYGVTS